MEARPAGSKAVPARRSLPVPPPREVRDRGRDLRRLELWRDAVDGNILTPGDELVVAPRLVRGRRLVDRLAELIPWLLLAAAFDLLMKRALRRDDF